MHFLSGLSIGFVVAASISSSAIPNDTTYSPYRDAIEYLQEHGVMHGYADGTFRPDNTINRAELLKLLIGSVDVQPTTEEFGHCFPDVNEEWFASYICFAKEQQWISGYGDGYFHPELPVNTAETIKMIVNVYGFELMQSSSTASFDDVDPSAWYAPYAALARMAGILDITSGTLGIGEYMSRGRVSGFIERSMRTREGTPTNIHATTSRSSMGIGARIRAIVERTPIHRGGGAGSNRIEDTTSNNQRVLSSPTISFSNINKAYGDADFDLSPISNSAGSFSYNSSNTDVATIAGRTVTIVGAGTTTITATQAADGDYTSGTTTATLTVGKATSSVTLTTSSGAIQYSTSLTFTATVTSGATGTISFYTGATLLGTSTIGHGSGSYITTTLKRGTGSITAAYGGDTNFNGSTSNTVLQKVYNNACLTAGLCQNGGTCNNRVNTYSCSCVAPYAGSRCELSYSFCTPAYGGTQCFNGGTCVPSVAGGECECAACYSGTYCDTYQADICA